MMNERIKECMFSAGLNSNYVEGFDSIYSNQLEKFAELIVRECAKVAGDFEYARLHDSLVEDKVLEHFGVE